MRTLRINKSPFYYAGYIGVSNTTEIDEDGIEISTGEMKAVYGSPVLSHGNISAAKGETEVKQFGEALIYDRVIVLDDVLTPIDEYSILWVDTAPGKTGGTADYDYVVKKVARSLNSVSIAISKVAGSA